VDYQAVLNDPELDPRAKALLRGLRQLVTKKTQAVSEEQKSLERARQELAERQKALLEGDFQDALKAQAEGPKEEEAAKYDPYDPDKTQAYIQQQIQQGVAQAMQQLTGKLQEVQQLQTRQRALDEFKASNPDLTENQEVRMEVAKLLEANEGMKLEHAYGLVKARGAKSEVERLREENQRLRATAQEHGYRTGGAPGPAGSDVPAEIIADPDPNVLMAYLEAQRQKK